MIVNLVGDFSVNGTPSVGMTVDTEQKIRFNEASGLVAIIAKDAEGKLVKGVAVASDPVLQAINQLGKQASRDESIRIPSGY